MVTNQSELVNNLENFDTFVDSDFTIKCCHYLKHASKSTDDDTDMVAKLKAIYLEIYTLKHLNNFNLILKVHETLLLHVHNAVSDRQQCIFQIPDGIPQTFYTIAS